MTINIKLTLTNEDVEDLLDNSSHEYQFKAKNNNINDDINIIIDKADPNITDLPLDQAMQLTTEPTPS